MRTSLNELREKIATIRPIKGENTATDETGDGTIVSIPTASTGTGGGQYQLTSKRSDFARIKVPWFRKHCESLHDDLRANNGKAGKGFSLSNGVLAVL